MASGSLPQDHPIYTTILEDYNRLRKLEDRPLVDKLPTEFEDLSHPRLVALSFRLKREIHWHRTSKKANKSLSLPYTQQIFLNETEYQLWLHNKRQIEFEREQITSVPAVFVSEKDTDFYHSTLVDPDTLIFVTDSEASLIQKPTYVDALKCYRSTHSLDGTFNPPPVTPTSSIAASQFEFPIPSSTPLNSSKDLDILNFEGLNLEGDTNLDKIESVSPNSDNSENIDSSDKDRLRQLLLKMENEQRKAMLVEEALLKIKKLEKENEALNAQFKSLNVQPRAVKTERQEIGDLKSQINDLVQMMKLVTMGQQLNATTDGEKKLIDRMNDTKSPPQITPLFVTLERPDNILDPDRKRDPPSLPCLKPSTIINTIGTYDPDTNPESDFRCIWDRIVDHTRNVLMYEHEYITCLRIVMKGSAGVALDKMNKEYKGDLNLILDAIQDLFIPQHTIFDEFTELNNFKRKPNEHMRTMVRRASLLIYKLKDTVSPAAWADRRHTLLSQIIKQVIDRKTFVHLRAEEIKCAQTGTSLSIEAMTNIIEFFETANDLIPTNEIKLSYDVQTMRLVNQPDIHKSELKELKDELSSLKASIKVLAPKRPRLNDTSVSIKKKLAHRKQLLPKRRLDEKMDVSANDLNLNRGIKRASPEQATPSQYKPQSTQKPQGRPNHNPQASTQAQYRPMNYNQAYTMSRPYYNKPKPVLKYHPDYYAHFQKVKADQAAKPNYGYKGGYKKQSKYGQPKKSYSFKGKKHTVELKFYKCAICPDAHEEGYACSSIRAIPFNPNE